uniref:IP21742p n=1 Tax=Drosophila melanogaster TaxID=7227 RepID=B3DN34_DROME|nr:IP21742p [Drosophila melanogaster]
MARGLVIGICWTLLWSIFVAGDFQLQNVICESFDNAITNFSRCEMKFIRRGVAAFYMVWKLYNVPIKSVDINAHCTRNRTDIDHFSLTRPWIFATTCGIRELIH